MDQELKKLISLQSVDDKIRDIESLSGDLPNRVENKESQLTSIQEKLEINNEKIDTLEKESRKLSSEITVTVFKVDGETNTDDLSPATHATTRPDIPLHALAMLETREPEALQVINSLKTKGYPIAYVGDVVGTGSSRKSAINSVLWHIGEDIPYVPNKRSGGIILGGTIAPIFFNTAEDSGALPIECDVSKLNTGDIITIFPYIQTILQINQILQNHLLQIQV